MTTKILILDDHPIVIEGIKQLLIHTSEFEVQGVHSFEALFAALKESIDILLLDININGKNSLSQIKDIKALKKEVKILIFSSYNSPSIIRKAFQESIHGFLLKDTSQAELLTALHTVAEGKVYVGKNVSIPHTSKALASSEFEDYFVKYSTLTKREQEITQLIVKGLSNKSIGAQLFISTQTVKVHRKNIFKKLDVHSAVELIKLRLNVGE